MPRSPDHFAASRRRMLVVGLVAVTLVLLVAGLASGSDGWSFTALIRLWQSADGGLIIGQIRLPRTLGAWLVGALLGLAGAVAQGLFRNPLADPYLLGSASGASLGVVLVLAASAIGSHAIGRKFSGGEAIGSAGTSLLMPMGLVGAAFIGAVIGTLLTLMLARGAQQTTRLLLAGVVVGVVLAAAGDLVTSAAPEALRGRQAFLLGSTGFLSWRSCAWLSMALAIALPIGRSLARSLDALTLGEDTAQSLGVPLRRSRQALVGVIALATAVAVSQAGLIAFVGLAAPHLVRRFAPSANGFLLVASAAAGGTLLLAADVMARVLIAPRELPVGVLTALLGGAYLLWLLHRGARR